MPIGGLRQLHPDHTSKVNRQIVQDFAAKAFPYGTIMPNEERSGFLIFELWFEERKGLTPLNLELTARNVVTEEPVTITVPVPAVTFTPKEEVSEGSFEP